MSLYPCFSACLRVVLLPFAGVVAAMPLHAAWSGSLETRFQSDSYFDSGNYAEQWLNLDYRTRDDSLTWGLLGNYGASRQESWMHLHRLYVGKDFFDNNLQAKLGRFEHIDTAGYSTLDGLDLRWRDEEGRQWEWFAGKPRRSELYFIPNSGNDGMDKPESKYMAGMRMSRSLKTENLGWLEDSSIGLGVRYHWSGVNTWKLDGSFAGNWSPVADLPPLELSAAMVLGTDSFMMESFDVQARMRLDDDSQLLLRGRRYDPPDAPITFADRYYGYYARGSQTVVEAGYQGRYSRNLTWGGNLRAIARELGVDGAGADLSLNWKLAYGATVEGRMEWLAGDGEYAGGLLLGYRRPLNSRLLLELNAAARNEYSRLDGSRTVIAGEVRLDWMWSRDLRLRSMLELARSTGSWEDYNQIRFGLRLVYQLPARGAEDYR
ncbi:hypothetical protein [Thiolapillus sp.]